MLSLGVVKACCIVMCLCVAEHRKDIGNTAIEFVLQLFCTLFDCFSTLLNRTRLYGHLGEVRRFFYPHYRQDFRW